MVQKGYAQIEIYSSDTLYLRPVAKEMIVTQNEDEIKVVVRNQDKDDVIIIPNKIDTVKGIEESYYKQEPPLWAKQHNFYIFPSNRQNRYWSIGIEGITLGLTSANGQPTPKGLQWGKSFEIGWLSIIDFKYNFSKSAVSLGIGLNWRNYKNSTSFRYLNVDNESGLIWKNYANDVNGKNSQLKLFAVQFPFLYELSIPKTSLFLKLGPIFNFNTYSSVKTSFTDSEGNGASYFTTSSIQRLLTVDIFANVSLSQMIGVYIRYSPMKILKTSDGINFHPFTLGFSIGI